MIDITISVNSMEEAQAFLSMAQRLHSPVAMRNRLSEAMHPTVFWDIVAMLQPDEEMSTREEAAIQRLSTFTAEDILRFQDLLAEQLYALDTEVLARRMIVPYSYRPDAAFSGDHFLYARCYVVAKGKAYYDQVVSGALSFSGENTFEPLLYLAETAWERQTGRDYEYLPTPSYETFSNLNGWEVSLVDRLLK